MNSRSYFIILFVLTFCESIHSFKRNLFTSKISNPYSIKCRCTEHLSCKLDDPHDINTGYCTIAFGGSCFSKKAVNIEALDYQTEFSQSGIKFSDDSFDRNFFTESMTLPYLNYNQLDAFFHTTYGCSDPQPSVLSFQSRSPKNTIPFAMSYCSDTDFCNESLTPTFHEFNSDKDVIDQAIKYITKMRKQKNSYRRINNISKHPPTRRFIGPDILQTFEKVPKYSDESKIFTEDEAIDYGYPSNLPKFIAIVLTSSALVILAIVSAVFYCIFQQRKRKANQLKMSNSNKESNYYQYRKPHSNSVMQSSMSTVTTNSLYHKTKINSVDNNSKYAQLYARTVGKDISIRNLIGKGKYSQSWADDGSETDTPVQTATDINQPKEWKRCRSGQIVRRSENRPIPTPQPFKFPKRMGNKMVFKCSHGSRQPSSMVRNSKGHDSLMFSRKRSSHSSVYWLSR